MRALEMWVWQVAWYFIWRLARRMMRNAKVDLVSEIVAMAVEGLRKWGLCLDDVQELVRAAYEEGKPGVDLSLQAVKAKLSPAIQPGEAPPLLGTASGTSPDLGPSKASDRPADHAPGDSTPGSGSQGPSGGGQ